MPFVNTKNLLLDAQKHKYAVGAFNIENMEMLQAVIAASEAEHAPVILQTTPGTLDYAGTSLFAAMAKALAQKASTDIALHLDHGNSFELCKKAATNGYTSLMIDGSQLPLEDNINLARSVVLVAGAMSPAPCVEAELGRLGGKEDDHEVKLGDDIYTNVQEAERFVQETGIDSLAVAIGTAHGFYKGEPKLDFVRLAELQSAIAIPLVLHGSSGVPDADVQRAIKTGVCKVNFATELRVAYTNAVRQALNNDEKIYDPKKYGALAREAVTKLVIHRIQICSGANV